MPIKTGGGSSCDCSRMTGACICIFDPEHVEDPILMGPIAFAMAGLGPGFPVIDAKMDGRKLIVIIRDEWASTPLESIGREYHFGGGQSASHLVLSDFAIRIHHRH
jgi:hypothetical protein